MIYIFWIKKLIDINIDNNYNINENLSTDI